MKAQLTERQLRGLDRCIGELERWQNGVQVSKKLDAYAQCEINTAKSNLMRLVSRLQEGR